MRIAVLRHHLEDDPGLLADSLVARGATVDNHHVLGSDGFPPLEGIDGAVVLGATWSLYDYEAVGGWIDEELDWLRRADAAGTPVLGVCFGAQALAAAHGGAVERAPRQEIGWTSVRTSRPELIGPGPWFEFHGDRCVVPPDAEVLAHNDVAVQAFVLRRNLAVQFHPEVEAQQLQRWLDNGGHAEAVAIGVDPERLVRDTVEEEPAARRRADGLIDTFLAIGAA